MKIPTWNKMQFSFLRLLSYIVPIRMRGTISTTNEKIDKENQKNQSTQKERSGFPSYRLNSDLVFLLDRFTNGPSGVHVVLKTLDEKRTVSVPKPLFELLFVKNEHQKDLT